MAKKKIGRPTDDPKTIKITARINEQTLEILKDYCERNNINKAQGIRDGLNYLKNK
ncbi:hypothetical protein [Vallitalea guaymasensis]|mgnify:CR=1 FL=1|uniref:Ribbon-helix-helix protein CopG domain-containing protein n=1 Tax=Vallitalea guaymasensis TaxID=1185412 RepID=A0A8J8M701_9FIRM|nr:hypothetical protein [Vallitalea guaymasensis]QUH27557.1 hypothetical protein HYG85_00925 [Vallitalea guaymasensis]